MLFFFFNDTATTEIYTLPLHDALPICGRCTGSPRTSRSWPRRSAAATPPSSRRFSTGTRASSWSRQPKRSEEHTSELQSRQYLVCRLLLEKKKHQNSMHLISS